MGDLEEMPDTGSEHETEQEDGRKLPLPKGRGFVVEFLETPPQTFATELRGSQPHHHSLQ